MTQQSPFFNCQEEFSDNFLKWQDLILQIQRFLKIWFGSFAAKNMDPVLLRCSGGSKMSQRWGHKNVLFGKSFAENCTKIKEIGPRVGRVCSAPPLPPHSSPWIRQWRVKCDDN